MEKLIIPKELTDPILKWVNKSSNRKKYFHTPPSHEGPVSGMRLVNKKSSPLYKEVMKLDKYILKNFGYSSKTPIDSIDGFFISYSEEGHKVHLHKDKNPDKDTYHVRFNVMISKPNRGGNPIINDKTIKVKEN